MATRNFLADSINVMHGKNAAVVDMLVAGFRAEYSHYIKANSSQQVDDARRLLGNSKKDKAVDRAIQNARITGTKTLAENGIFSGYIGAKDGAFKAQNPEVQKPYIDALDAAVATFEKTIIESGEFADKAPLSDAEKAVKKQEKAEKIANERAEIIAQAIKEGVVVPVGSVSTLTMDSITVEDMLDELLRRSITPEQFATYAKTKTTTA